MRFEELNQGCPCYYEREEYISESIFETQMETLCYCRAIDSECKEKYCPVFYFLSRLAVIKS